MDYKNIFVTLPQKDNLCCMICKIIINENDPVMIYPEDWRYKLKIRKFLEEISMISIAAPKNEEFKAGFFYVIIIKNFFESFQAFCKILNIEMVYQLDPIPTSIYKKCVLYTVEYELEPQWNKVGQYLIERQDFLISSGNVNAIKLNIIDIRDNKVLFRVKSLKLKIPFLRLNAARSLQHDFKQPVRVLPSLKVANVLSISKEIRKHHLFEDYEDLCLYWKNMHGYILPDYEENILFYDIKLLNFYESSAFVYPDMCLLSGPIETLSLMADQASRICARFEEDLKRVIVQRNYASNN